MLISLPKVVATQSSSPSFTSSDIARVSFMGGKTGCGQEGERVKQGVDFGGS